MRTFGALLLVAVLLGRATPLYAQQGTDDPTSAARIEFAQGVESFEAERFDEALDHFERAWRLRPHPTVRVNLASCYAKLGRAPAAVMHYRAYLADRSVQLSRGARREIQESLRALEPGVGVLDLVLSPADARVRLDGEEPDARDGARLFVAPGTHRVEVSAPGRASRTRVVEVAGGSAQSVAVELAVETPAPPPPAEPTPPPPPREPAPPPPPREPRATPAPEEGHVEDDDVSPLEETPRGEETTPSGEGSGRKVLRWGAYGLAGVAIVGASVLGVMAMGADGDFDDGATRIESHDYANEAERAAIERQARDDADRANTFALMTDVCLGVAVAGAVTGTILLLTAPSASSRDEARAPLRVGATMTPRQASVLLAGTF